ncbi:exodeoxyribonuclease V subunit alpha [Pantoea sp. Nvir]|uniref:exodeoxyribonuclease V subunit alpha n=1 Tax=Pantoea sp. Nvir TaxID=2576760 RepID=UPI00135C78B9|nr:exodeoxyribonuclease V subunit alpha [Pantoea sp. Nvir]MXP66405.1 exodeoxyribonuclease V subunit alpha [Pantoea sp. Nvir]
MTEIMSLLNQAVEKRLLRPLDLQFARLLTDNSHPAWLLAAACVSSEAGDGHVCLPIAHLNTESLLGARDPELAKALWRAAGAPPCWQTVLSDWPALSNGRIATPLVLDHNRLYLHRLWQSEGQVVRFFTLKTDIEEIDCVAAQNVLSILFGDHCPDDWQKIAAAVALTSKIAVISGGPGTGKTTIVAKLLTAMIRMSHSSLRIQLAAPTGKAAARLTESLSKALQVLSVSSTERARFPNEATTLHRLLGAQFDTQRLRYHTTNRLHLDVLVVDETSMIDISMMAKLIAALPDHARVIFLGDRDQLGSVEAGTVLSDICHFAEMGYSLVRAQQLNKLTKCMIQGVDDMSAPDLRDSICLLRKSYRFNVKSGISQLARAVNLGDIREVKEMFNAKFDDITFQRLQNGEAYQEMLDAVAEGYRPFLSLVQSRASIKEILLAFSQYQLLCVLRDGQFGVQGLNQRIEQRLLQLKCIRRPVGDSSWYAGRPIMVIRNDSVLGLSNGDIGITLHDMENQIKVFFSLPDGTVKAVHPSRLPSYNTVWAMTVHKSQGSEFDHAVLVMPVQFSPLLTRELVYTAVTRARNRLTLYSEPVVLQRALQLKVQRRSGLVERLTAAT